MLLAVVHVTSLKDSKPAKMKPNVGPGGHVLARYLVLNVGVFEKATRGYRLHRAACALAGGPVRPGKDISAAFWEDGESHRQRSLL